MNYLEMLNESYKNYIYEETTYRGNTEEECDKFEFLAAAVFNFITYENVVAIMMANKALEVCKAITEKKTFEYINTEEGNLWYLVMVNTSFFEDKLNWGGSIRGAWWDLYGEKAFTVESCDLFSEGEQLLDLELKTDEWESFIVAMCEFVGWKVTLEEKKPSIGEGFNIEVVYK